MLIFQLIYVSLICFTVAVSNSEPNTRYNHDFDPRSYKTSAQEASTTPDLNSLIPGALTSDTALRNLYSLYRVEHGVSHGDHETPHRLRLFRDFLVEVTELQRDESVKWTPGITFMGHMTECEKSLLSSGNVTDHLDTWNSEDQCDEYNGGEELKRDDSDVLQAFVLPESYDWRALGAVTDVKDQLGGDCWAYAAVTAMEAQIMYLRGVLSELSTQELVDCVYYGYGVNHFEDGGLPHHAWDHITKDERIGYRYQIPERPVGFYSCSYGSWARNALKDNNVEIRQIVILRKRQATPSNLMTVIARVSPVIVIISTKGADLDKYNAGAFDPRTSKCNQNSSPDHAVAIVGYDKDYFYIKNSWGEKWGNKGYLWWIRAPGRKDCNLYAKSMYPIMEKTRTKK